MAFIIFAFVGCVGPDFTRWWEVSGLIWLQYLLPSLISFIFFCTLDISKYHIIFLIFKRLQLILGNNLPWDIFVLNGLWWITLIFKDLRVFWIFTYFWMLEIYVWCPSDFLWLGVQLVLQLIFKNEIWSLLHVFIDENWVSWICCIWSHAWFLLFLYLLGDVLWDALSTKTSVIICYVGARIVNQNALGTANVILLGHH